MLFASISLAARIERAEARLMADAVAVGREGCDVDVVTTQPGSKSQENAQRHGLELLDTRAVLVRPA
jgi:hypothetical protein